MIVSTVTQLDWWGSAALERRIVQPGELQLEELRARALELSTRVVRSYSLAATVAEEITEIQDELLAEVQRRSPTRADALRRMLHRLNENHLACLIHVSERTHSLVFVEFVRQSLGFLGASAEDSVKHQ